MRSEQEIKKRIAFLKYLINCAKTNKNPNYNVYGKFQQEKAALAWVLGDDE